MRCELSAWMERVARNPADAKARYGAAWEYWLLGDLENALMHLDQALSREPMMGDAWWLRGKILRGQDDLLGARDSLRLASKLCSDPAPPARELGEVLLQLGELDDALACARRSVDSARTIEDRAAAYWLQGTVWGRRGEPERACKAFEEAASAHPAGSELQYALGTALFDLGQYERALEAFERAASIDPKYSQYWSAAAYAAERCGRLSRARTALDRALTLDGSDVRARSALVGILFQLGELDAAVEDGLRSLAAAPDQPGVHHNLSEAYRLNGELTKAEEHARRAVALSDDPRAKLGLAQVLLDAGDYSGAETQLRTILNNSPEHPEAVVLLVESLANQGKLHESEAIARKEITQRPDSPFSWVSLARALDHAGNTGEAGKALQRATALSPDNPWVAWAVENHPKRFRGLKR